MWCSRNRFVQLSLQLFYFEHKLFHKTLHCRNPNTTNLTAHVPQTGCFCKAHHTTLMLCVRVSLLMSIVLFSGRQHRSKRSLMISGALSNHICIICTNLKKVSPEKFRRTIPLTSPSFFNPGTPRLFCPLWAQKCAPWDFNISVISQHVCIFTVLSRWSHDMQVNKIFNLLFWSTLI